MIHRGPGCLAVVWFGSSPHALPPLPSEICFYFSVFLWVAGRAYWRWGGTKSYGGEKAWSSINHSILSALRWRDYALQRQFRLYIPFLGIAASAPISTFMCLWAIYIFPGSVHIFPPAEKADPSWKYIIRSQTHESWNWDWGPDISFMGIFLSNFRHFVFAVWWENRSFYSTICRED